MLKFSIIIPVYNAEKTLLRTISSLLLQTYKNFEIIYIDGGSVDNSNRIIKEKLRDMDIHISEKDNGIYDAMNKGRKIASGDFVIFFGADDVFFDIDVIEKISKNITNMNNIYYGDVFFKNRRKNYNFEFSKYKLFQRNICHQAIFYPKNIYKNYEYNIDYKMFADYDYNLRVFSKEKFCYIPLTIAIFNDFGSSSQGDKLFDKKKAKIIFSIFGFYDMCLFLLMKPFSRYYYSIKNYLKYR